MRNVSIVACALVLFALSASSGQEQAQAGPCPGFLQAHVDWLRSMEANPGVTAVLRVSIVRSWVTPQVAPDRPKEFAGAAGYATGLLVLKHRGDGPEGDYLIGQTWEYLLWGGGQGQRVEHNQGSRLTVTIWPATGIVEFASDGATARLPMSCLSDAQVIHVPDDREAFATSTMTFTRVVQPRGV